MAYRVIPHFPLSLSLSLSLSVIKLWKKVPVSVRSRNIRSDDSAGNIDARNTHWNLFLVREELNGGALTRKIRDTERFVIEATCKSYVAYQRCNARRGRAIHRRVCAVSKIFLEIYIALNPVVYFTGKRKRERERESGNCSGAMALRLIG